MIKMMGRVTRSVMVKALKEKGRVSFEQREQGHDVFPQHRIAVHKKAAINRTALSGIALQRRYLSKTCI
jgi:hypothetical protein